MLALLPVLFFLIALGAINLILPLFVPESREPRWRDRCAGTIVAISIAITTLAWLAVPKPGTDYYEGEGCTAVYRGGMDAC